MDTIPQLEVQYFLPSLLWSVLFFLCFFLIFQIVLGKKISHQQEQQIGDQLQISRLEELENLNLLREEELTQLKRRLLEQLQEEEYEKSQKIHHLVNKFKGEKQVIMEKKTTALLLNSGKKLLEKVGIFLGKSGGNQG